MSKFCACIDILIDMESEKQIWSDICENIDLENVDTIIKQVSLFETLSIRQKINIMNSIDHMFEQSFECYMWVTRKIDALKHIILSTTSEEERHQNMEFICDNFDIDDTYVVEVLKDPILLEYVHKKKEKPGDDSDDDDDDQADDDDNLCEEDDGL